MQGTAAIKPSACDSPSNMQQLFTAVVAGRFQQHRQTSHISKKGHHTTAKRSEWMQPDLHLAMSDAVGLLNMTWQLVEHSLETGTLC